MDIKKTYTGIVSLCLALLLVFGAPISAIDPPTAENLSKVQKVLKSKTGDYTERSIRRVGNNTLEFEGFLSTEADWEMMKQIISHYSEYPNWVMKKINDRPRGGKYYIQILELKGDPKDPNILEGDFSVKLPVSKLSIQRKFKMNTSEKDGVFTLYCETLPHETSPVTSMSGYMQFFRPNKGDSRVWVYASLRVTIRYWLLYEALPEHLLNRESGERMQILLDNYQNEENRLRAQQTTGKK